MAINTSTNPYYDDYDQDKKFHIIYETTNKINGKFYIGKHSTKNKKDVYLGSGIALVRAIEKYGKESFFREILRIFDNEKDAYEFERFIVNENLINNINCYNISIGGQGWKDGISLPDETKEKISKTLKNRYKTGMINAFKNKKHTEAAKKKMSGLRPIVAKENNPMWGTTMSQESKERMIKTKKKNYIKENHPNFGKKFSKERCQKMSKDQVKFNWHIKGEIFSLRNDAAEYFGVCTKTITKWCASIVKDDCYKERIC